MANFFLKNCIINVSLPLKTDDCKLSQIVPIHKSGRKEYIRNYRPISKIPCIPKLLYPPQRGYISFVNTFVTPRNNDLGPYVPWRHLISVKL